MGLLLFYISLALSLSFLCSLIEAVLLHVTPSYIAAALQEEKPFAASLQRFHTNIERPLAAIASLHTLARTVGVAGASTQALLFFESVSIGLLSGLFALLLLVFSQFIPRILGAVYWRRLLPFTVHFLEALVWWMQPFVWLSLWIERWIASERLAVDLSREELTAITELGWEKGVLEEEESRILRNLFRFGSLTVRDVMTPRTVVFCLPQTMKVDDVLKRHKRLPFTRVPIYDKGVEDVTGYVRKDEVLLKAAHDQGDTPLLEIRRPILILPDSLLLPRAFERLLQERSSIAYVADEYGGMAGLVTVEDIVETILGLEIVDEADSAKDMQELARQQWRKRALALGLHLVENEHGELAIASESELPAFASPSSAPPAKTEES